MQHIISIIVVFLLSTLGVLCGQWDRLNNRDLGQSAKLFSNGSVLFHYNDASAYRSDDLGKSWMDISMQFPRGAQSITETSSGLLALSTNSESGAILVMKSGDAGITWRTASAFSIGASAKILDLVKEGNRLLAVTSGRSFYFSEDQGITWKESKLPLSIGTVVDVSTTDEIWIACGTESVFWSSNAGLFWNISPTPTEVGTIMSVESNVGRIWAGGVRGTCWFDAQSRSWIVDNTGLAQYAQITSSPISLISFGKVLFGVFVTLDGAQKVYSRQGWQEKWELVKVFGLPTHNSVRSHSIAVMNNMIFVYHRGDDVTTRGVYAAQHQVAVGVEEDLLPVENASLSVWPNPASSVINLSLSAPQNANYTVVDVVGNTWAEFSGAPTSQLSIVDLPTGQYFVSTTVHGKAITQRFEVQR